MVVGLYVIAVTWIKIKYHWFEPDPELIEHFKERFVNPPMVATMIAFTIGGIIGIKGIRPWMRGEWTVAVVHSVLFIIMGAVATYLLPPDP